MLIVAFFGFGLRNFLACCVKLCIACVVSLRFLRNLLFLCVIFLRVALTCVLLAYFLCVSCVIYFWSALFSCVLR